MERLDDAIAEPEKSVEVADNPYALSMIGVLY